ncbi:MAG: signal peptide peptidase SppA [Paludibacteraceae bacterium]|nr:signal peptide peptidase SppA [Paludibacteraceae bacterium]
MSLFHKKNEQNAAPRRRNHGCLWAIIIGLIIYMVLTFISAKFLNGVFSGSSSEAHLKNHSIYKFELSGTVVEQAPMDNPFSGFMSTMPGYNMEEVIGLDQILSNIRLAQGSDKIQGIYLYGGNLSVGQASAKAIRDALVEFKSSGKFIVAYADSYSQSNYYIASVADSIYLSPIGNIQWNGLTAQKMYYTRLLEKLGVKVQILKVGTFKSAVEPFFCTEMSEADRQQTMIYLGGVWNLMKQAVSDSRGISIEQLDEYADLYMGLRQQTEYVERGFCDRLVYEDEMDSILTKLAGTEDYHTISFHKLANVKRAESSVKDAVAVLYLDGEITSGTGNGIVDTKVLKTLREIQKNKHIKALVLRVNSPGGSADASELINHAVRQLQQEGLPVVVSMGDYAASGGYYISCEADYIFAEPNTLTGSIGIFGMVPSFGELREKVGLDIDGVSTNRHSDLDINMVYRGMDEEEHQIMQSMVERGYELFTSRCAEGRNIPQDSIKAIGEGRVWLGQDAIRLGLVDQLGNLDDAIKKAAQLADLNEYSLSYFPEPSDPMADLLSMFDNSSDEEKILMRFREFVSQPRVLALMPEVKIQ